MNNELKFTIEENSLNFGIKEQFNITETTSYRPLTDKPQINYKVLESGNNSFEKLGIEPTITDITEQDIDKILYGG